MCMRTIYPNPLRYRVLSYNYSYKLAQYFDKVSSNWNLWQMFVFIIFQFIIVLCIKLKSFVSKNSKTSISFYVQFCSEIIMFIWRVLFNSQKLSSIHRIESYPIIKIPFIKSFQHFNSHWSFHLKFHVFESLIENSSWILDHHLSDKMNWPSLLIVDYINFEEIYQNSIWIAESSPFENTIIQENEHEESVIFCNNFSFINSNTESVMNFNCSLLILYALVKKSLVLSNLSVFTKSASLDLWYMLFVSQRHWIINHRWNFFFG